MMKLVVFVSVIAICYAKTCEKEDEKWEEDQKKCYCGRRWIPGDTFMTRRPLVAMCKYTGCMTYGRKFYKEGESAKANNGAECKCVKGSDPSLADAYTLFHFDCNKKGHIGVI